jgi:hypothetical protein
VTFTPFGQHRGPLAHPVKRVDLLTAGNHAAIDDSCHQGRQHVFARRKHGFVEESHAVFDPALPHQGLALQIPGEGDQIRFIESVANLGSARGGGVGRVVLAGGKFPQRGGEQQVSLFDAVLIRALDDPLDAGKPSARAARLSKEQEADRQPESGASRAHALAGVETRVIDAFEHSQEVVVAPDERSRPRQHIEVIGTERRGLVGACQQPIRIVPGLPPIGLATVIEFRQRFRAHAAGTIHQKRTAKSFPVANHGLENAMTTTWWEPRWPAHRKNGVEHGCANCGRQDELPISVVLGHSAGSSQMSAIDRYRYRRP